MSRSDRTTRPLRTTGRIALAGVLSASLMGGPLAIGAQAQSAAAQYGSASVTGTATTRGTTVDFASFGTVDANVRKDVETALQDAGLPFRFVAFSDGRFAAFQQSGLAKSLSTGSTEDLGKAVAAQLLQNTTQAAQVFQALFTSTEPFRPFTSTVISRSEQLSASRASFAKGAAAGFGAGGVPAVYVERSDDKTSHVSEFRNIPGVSIVDDIDTPSGKSRLVSLLTGGPTTSGVSTTVPKISAKTSSAITKASSSNSGAPLALLVGLVGALVLVLGGAATRLRRR